MYEQHILICYDDEIRERHTSSYTPEFEIRHTRVSEQATNHRLSNGVCVCVCNFWCPSQCPLSVY